MKKVLVVLLSLLIICGCETQEQRDIRKHQEEIAKATQEVSSSNIPENAKKWLVDVKTEKVVTVLCITTSHKCKNIQENFDQIDNKLKYFINLDEIEDDEKNVYKTTFELDDYTSYVPYVMISEKNKLLTTKTNITIEELNEILNPKKEENTTKEKTSK